MKVIELNKKIAKQYYSTILKIYTDAYPNTNWTLKDIKNIVDKREVFYLLIHEHKICGILNGNIIKTKDDPVVYSVLKNEQTLIISDIISNVRNGGKLLMEKAIRYNLNIFITVLDSELCSFYKKFGFVEASNENSDVIIMTRKANKNHTVTTTENPTILKDWVANLNLPAQSKVIPVFRGNDNESTGCKKVSKMLRWLCGKNYIDDTPYSDDTVIPTEEAINILLKEKAFNIHWVEHVIECGKIIALFHPFKRYRSYWGKIVTEYTNNSDNYPKVVEKVFVNLPPSNKDKITENIIRASESLKDIVDKKIRITIEVLD